MTTILTIIVVILAFSFLIFIHELGHFLMAKKAGIKVIEFAIGFPPRIWSKKKGETRYSLNAIPFGGYVKLYGEDATDSKVLKSKKSFASKSLRQRIGVVIGGVIMNFLVAFILFTVGFTIGMKPMIPDGPTAINDGTIETEVGIVVDKVDKRSPFSNLIQPGDSIRKINGQPLNDFENLPELFKPENTTIDSLTVLRNNEEVTFQSQNPSLPAHLIPHQFQQYFPRLKINEVVPDSKSAEAGLQKGDIILRINNQHILSFEQYLEITKSQNTLNYEILRDNETLNFTVQLPLKKVIIANISPDSPAEKAGIEVGDIITIINNQEVKSPEEAIAAIKSKQGPVEITINRDQETITIKTNLNQNGLLGISPRLLHNANNQQLDLYLTTLPTSFTKINPVQYPLHLASIESLKLMKKLSLLTGAGFINTLQSIFISLEVPEDIGGAVAITTMIYDSVQTGIMDLIQLIAYISLVLAVINILPLPALDGGRLFFLIIEGIAGKRLNPKWEAHIHAIGFLLLLALILIITYNDILRLS